MIVIYDNIVMSNDAILFAFTANLLKNQQSSKLACKVPIFLIADSRRPDETPVRPAVDSSRVSVWRFPPHVHPVRESAPEVGKQMAMTTTVFWAELSSTTPVHIEGRLLAPFFMATGFNEMRPRGRRHYSLQAAARPGFCSRPSLVCGSTVRQLYFRGWQTAIVLWLGSLREGSMMARRQNRRHRSTTIRHLIQYQRQ
jgi:hypothetical protein